ncbi:MAG: hypothetical protein C4B59_10160 [Candidatus Methanogaster sp.]|uniref:Uncharacterized protein n=1 Tax=Candidatus Methanogaster sp. TaxID=3386292 RepID=A0AC61L218_9EURY|nr:MAG: hypothetical protein C4B59_10160 [ANME-2 cluster archaeon]
MAPLLQTCDDPFLNISEGVLIYLHRKDVKSLVIELQSRFPGSELVWGEFNYLWLKKPLRGLVNFKMRKELHLGKGATFHFGIREVEELNQGIVFLGDWSYFDSQEKKLGWLRFLGRVGLFRKAQWTVHYRLTGDVTWSGASSPTQREFYVR